MNITELIKQRYSCRKYKDQRVSKDLIMEILNDAHMAPSAKNLQPWKFVALDEGQILDDIKDCYGREWIKSAPAVIAVCGDHNTAWARESDGKVHTDIDIAIAIDHLTLSATYNGLGTCWICRFDAQKAAEILNIPEGWEVIALVPLGYPADTPDVNRHERLRKSVNEVVSYNGW